MALTPEAKKLLADTIRDLRSKLLLAVHDEADRRYRLSVALKDAGLDEAHRRRRERIEAWIDEQARAQKPKNAKELKAVGERLLAKAEKETAATLINRLVLLRQLEATGLSRPQVVTGGWNSKGYREFRDFAPTLCTNGTTDATEGYATLLGLVFDELAVDLPGLYGDVGLTKLFPIPPATLREVIDRLDSPELASAWTDDTTQGWVYQYWNDPDREALDAKINGGGKIEPHEIASKTQMFTERYMVEWLLQNSLGMTWLAMCNKHGWTAEAERVLPVLDARRADWREKREAGEVALDALMPIEGKLEEHWKYYVPQPIPDDAVEHAPESVRAIKLLDPACGSGHFLVTAFDLLAALYEEEARHRGQSITKREIAESILDNNLHGIDIDPRAIQIAAAGLYLKGRTFAKNARPRTLNLVAPALQLGNLPEDDENLSWFTLHVAQEVGMPEAFTRQLVKSLAPVDHLGSLLQVESALRDTLEAFDRDHGPGTQTEFGKEASALAGSRFDVQGMPLQVVAARSTTVHVALTEMLERFLARHSKSEDLGLRLDGEQLASGVRFVRLAREGTYDIVVGNPPYQGLSKTEAFGYVTRTYPRGKADLYAAFLERALQLARPGGTSALVTMRGWMFLGQFNDLRRSLLHEKRLQCIGDLGTGAFSSRSMDDVISTALVVVSNGPPKACACGVQAAPISDPRRDAGKPARREAALLAHENTRKFDPRGFEVIEGEPIVYWWTKEFLKRYADAPKIGQVAPARQGITTGDNARFLRTPWEVARNNLLAVPIEQDMPSEVRERWVPLVKGAEGRAWFEPLTEVVDWLRSGLAMWLGSVNGKPSAQLRNPGFFFHEGVAFTTTGASFAGRAHRFRSVFENKGRTIFSERWGEIVCLLNTRAARYVVESLNPTIDFTVGDVNRLPVFPIAGAASVVAQLLVVFDEHESSREPAIQFRRPGPTAWRHTQDWAQRAVDRPDGQPLPPYASIFDQPAFEANLSFLIGIALGRFDANGTGVLDIAPQSALPAGIFFVSAESNDSLDHPVCKRLVDEFQQQSPSHVETKDYALSEYLRKVFFGYHKKLYENRPIYFPLSSAKKTFVAFASIHCWQDDTLNVLLADHLVPTRRRLEGELDDLRTARASGTSKGKAEKRFAEVQKLLEELNDFIAKVAEVAENGPSQPDDKTPKREIDAKYVMDLDDGVMVNSAALWPLLEPQWKDAKKWWKELASAQGKKEYDWSHLAARYFPTRVRAKCHDDPSLAVAHKSLWELHPAKAYAWELRLQDEIKPDFRIDEPGSDAARAKFLSEHERQAKEIYAAEIKRRERKAAKADAEEATDQRDMDYDADAAAESIND